MTRIALSQAIENMERTRAQTGTINALREWRVTMAQQIIRPAKPSKGRK